MKCLPRHVVAALAATFLALGIATSCAPAKRRVGVPIDARPTPPATAAAETTRTAGSTAPMTTRTVTTTRQRIASESAAARTALDRCKGRNLLPDQQGVVDSATALLAQSRQALAAGDLRSAESRARQARQLTASLRCR